MIGLDLSPEARRDPTSSRQITDEYEEKAVASVRAFLKRISEDLGGSSFAHTTSVERLSPLQFLKYISRVAREEMIDSTAVWRDELIKTSYRQGNEFMGIVLGAPRPVRRRAWKKIGVLVERNNGAFSKMASDLSQRVRGIIADGIVQEKSQKAIIDAIMRLSDAAESDARRIVRTEAMDAVNTAVIDGYANEGVEYVQLLAAEDAKLCEECAALDGLVFRIEDAPLLPLHPNCRCTFIAYIHIQGEEMPVLYRWDAESGQAVEA